MKRILDIWNDGYGIISIHVFQNSLPVEAFCREAAMIEAVGMLTQKLLMLIGMMTSSSLVFRSQQHHECQAWRLLWNLYIVVELGQTTLGMPSALQIIPYFSPRRRETNPSS